ncbi:MAG: hypothetical protein PHE33_10855 [Bacteroidales bacterium]|nr:hypothetical protein [Bacteroidales bacterium]
MKTIKLNILILIVTTLISCSAGLTSKPKQSIYLFKDKDGLYLYNPTASKEKIIFKATDKQVFLDEPLKVSGDTLTFGFKGELVFGKTSPTESGGERYFNDYFSVDLKTGKKWLSGKILYEVVGHSKLNIKTLLIDPNGKTTVVSDTSMIYKGSDISSKGVIYNNLEPSFFSRQTLGDKSVFSLRGSIYFTDKSDTTLLVEYKGQFDPKFGSGYFQPQLDPTGQYVVFRYSPGFMHFKEDASLQKIDIKTKKIEIIKTGNFNDPTFSTDGKFILFKRDQREGKSNTWVSKIYLLDLTTLKEQKISNAYSAQWGQ